jgi:hypothetical protein
LHETLARRRIARDIRVPFTRLRVHGSCRASNAALGFDMLATAFVEVSSASPSKEHGAVHSAKASCSSSDKAKRVPASNNRRVRKTELESRDNSQRSFVQLDLSAQCKSNRAKVCGVLNAQLGVAQEESAILECFRSTRRVPYAGEVFQLDGAVSPLMTSAKTTATFANNVESEKHRHRRHQLYARIAVTHSLFTKSMANLRRFV